MFRFPLILALILGFNGFALAQDSKNPKDLQRQINKLGEQLERLKAEVKHEEAQGEDSPLLYAFRSLDTYGSLTASYAYNLGGVDKRRGGNRFRLSDNDNNTFAIPFARLGARRVVSGLDEWDVGFGLEVTAGSMVPDLFKNDEIFERGAINVPQAYVDLKLPTAIPLVLRAGRMYLPFGVETVDPQENLHHSLSFMSQFMPRTVTGAALGVQLTPSISYTQYVVNGWEKVVDNNDAKTFAGQLAWTPEGSKARVAFNWIAGAEREDSEGDNRWALQLAAEWQPSDSLELRAAVLYGQEEFTSPFPQFSDVDAEFGGFTASVKKSFFYDELDDYYQLGLVGRVSYFVDEFGIRSETGLDQELTELTATLEIRPLKEATIRVEYRRDFSNRSGAFGGGRGILSRSSQDTFSFSVGYMF